MKGLSGSVKDMAKGTLMKLQYALQANSVCYIAVKTRYFLVRALVNTPQFVLYILLYQVLHLRFMYLICRTFE
jgi:hypothetical protein